MESDIDNQLNKLYLVKENGRFKCRNISAIHFTQLKLNMFKRLSMSDQFIYLRVTEIIENVIETRK